MSSKFLCSLTASSYAPLAPPIASSDTLGNPGYDSMIKMCIACPAAGLTAPRLTTKQTVQQPSLSTPQHSLGAVGTSISEHPSSSTTPSPCSDARSCIHTGSSPSPRAGRYPSSGTFPSSSSSPQELSDNPRLLAMRSEVHHSPPFDSPGGHADVAESSEYSDDYSRDARASSCEVTPNPP